MEKTKEIVHQKKWAFSWFWKFWRVSDDQYQKRTFSIKAIKGYSITNTQTQTDATKTFTTPHSRVVYYGTLQLVQSQQMPGLIMENDRGVNWACALKVSMPLSYGINLAVNATNSLIRVLLGGFGWRAALCHLLVYSPHERPSQLWGGSEQR